MPSVCPPLIDDDDDDDDEPGAPVVGVGPVLSEPELPASVVLVPASPHPKATRIRAERRRFIRR
jgi:hypothetical protein